MLEVVADDGLQVGDRFPSGAALCERFEMSRTAVRRALTQLEGRGVLEAQHGKGRIVRALPEARLDEDMNLRVAVPLRDHAEKDSRVAPVPPEFVRLLRWHLVRYGSAPDGRLFRTSRGGVTQDTGYGEVWAAARAEVLTAEEAASPLAWRPYDLRAAGVSFWAIAEWTRWKWLEELAARLPSCSASTRRCSHGRRSARTNRSRSVSANGIVPGSPPGGRLGDTH
uniref:GntR family transcriptional regulator n=1 Tax=Streptomyces physcomitrii TaxID=2724184 RepID=UPI0035E42E4A